MIALALRSVMKAPPARALLQLQQAGVFERAQGFAQRVARDPELLGERSLGGQPAPDPEPAGDQLGADLGGDLFERSGGAGSP